LIWDGWAAEPPNHPKSTLSHWRGAKCRRIQVAPLGLLPFRHDGLYWQYDYLSAHAGAFMILFSPHGQGFLEYALLIILVGMAVLIALAIFGTGVGNLFSNIVSNF
jgi:hypothetical protein